MSSDNCYVVPHFILPLPFTVNANKKEKNRAYLGEARPGRIDVFEVWLCVMKAVIQTHAGVPQQCLRWMNRRGAAPGATREKKRVNRAKAKGGAGGRGTQRLLLMKHTAPPVFVEDAVSVSLPRNSDQSSQKSGGRHEGERQRQ